MKILAVDSSANTASVAINSDGNLVGEFFINAGLTHSQTLMPIIENLCIQTGILIKDIDLFAVTHGPGSFTGLRIGIATIKGMAIALNKPCVGISTLEVMAYNAIGLEGVICCCIDARRNQLYNAIFEQKDDKIVRLVQDRAIDIEDLMVELNNCNKKIIYVGNGSEMCYNMAKKNFLGINSYILPERVRDSRASALAQIAYNMHKENVLNYSDELKPRYLRMSKKRAIVNLLVYY